MNKTYSLNTIFQYTESLVKVQEDTLNRLDSKFSTFIGFSSVLVRLAMDLQDEHIKVIVCCMGVVSIILGATGLMATVGGASLHPRTLLESEHLDDGEMAHQLLIVTDQIDLMSEYQSLMKRKHSRNNWMIGCFCLAIVFYGLGVSGLISS